MQFVQVTYDNLGKKFTWPCMGFTWTYLGFQKYRRMLAKPAVSELAFCATREIWQDCLFSI
jgi:hypothetical protein